VRGFCASFDAWLTCTCARAPRGTPPALADRRALLDVLRDEQDAAGAAEAEAEALLREQERLRALLRTPPLAIARVQQDGRWPRRS
jgi:hypothetical protein